MMTIIMTALEVTVVCLIYYRTRVLRTALNASLAKESHFEKNKREIPEATEQLLHYFLSPVLSKMLPIDSLSQK